VVVGRVRDRVDVERGDVAVDDLQLQHGLMIAPWLVSRGEIAEVGWFDPDAVPEPRTNLLGLALDDARAGRRGIHRKFELD
jgi:hypothetical protein